MRLNYNVKAFTNYDNMKHIILQGGGYSLPIDLIDRNIKVNGIEFTFRTVTERTRSLNMTQ